MAYPPDLLQLRRTAESVLNLIFCVPRSVTYSISLRVPCPSNCLARARSRPLGRFDLSPEIKGDFSKLACYQVVDLLGIVGAPSFGEDCTEETMSLTCEEVEGTREGYLFEERHRRKQEEIQQECSFLSRRAS